MSRGFSSYLPECNCYLTAINCTNTIEELIWVADWNSKEKSKNVTQDISNDCRVEVLLMVSFECQHLIKIANKRGTPYQLTLEGAM
jgi:hypothetical protein